MIYLQSQLDGYSISKKTEVKINKPIVVGKGLTSVSSVVSTVTFCEQYNCDPLHNIVDPMKKCAVMLSKVAINSLLRSTNMTCSTVTLFKQISLKITNHTIENNFSIQ